MITCYARIAPTLANAILYCTFTDAVCEACEVFNYPNAFKLFDDVCGDVWRECKRSGDMRAWELFKLHANRCLHETGELADDRVLAFTWDGSLY